MTAARLAPLRLPAAACSPGRCPQLERLASEQRSRYLPSRFASVLIFCLSMRSSPAGRACAEPPDPRLAGEGAFDLAAFSRGRACRSSNDFFDLRDSSARIAASRSASAGLKQSTNRSPVPMLDFLDLHVVLDGRVTALPRQGRFDLGGPDRSFCPMMYPAAPHQRPAVLLRGEAAVGDPDDPRQGPVPDVGADLADQVGVGRPPRPGPDPRRDAVRVTAIPITTCGKSSRESFDLPWVRNPVSFTAASSPSATQLPSLSRGTVSRPRRSRNRWRSCRRKAGLLQGSAGR